MVNSTRLLTMVRKWKRLAALGKRRLSWGRTNSSPKSDVSTASVADKGFFVVYSTEGRRFMVPLTYLNSSIFVELFKMAEEEFGLPADGPITLPCQAAYLESILHLLGKGVKKNVERASLSSMSKDSCSSTSSYSLPHNQQLALCGF